MIFNLNKQGAAELRRMTGNYYAGNDFSAIEWTSKMLRMN